MQDGTSFQHLEQCKIYYVFYETFAVPRQPNLHGFRNIFVITNGVMQLTYLTFNMVNGVPFLKFHSVYNYSGMHSDSNTSSMHPLNVLNILYCHHRVQRVTVALHHASWSRLDLRGGWDVCVL